MKHAGSGPTDNGVWLDSDEVHELRDQIQALKVGYALLSGNGGLGKTEVQEVYREMGEAISKLADSSIFRGKEKGQKKPPQAGQ